MKLTKTLIRTAIVVLHNRAVEHYANINVMDVLIDDAQKVTFDIDIESGTASAKFLSPILTTIMALEKVLQQNEKNDDVVMEQKLELLLAMTTSRLSLQHLFVEEEIEAGKTDELYGDVIQNFEFWKAVNWIHACWYN